MISDSSEPMELGKVHIFLKAVHPVLIIRSKIHFGYSFDFYNFSPLKYNIYFTRLPFQLLLESLKRKE